MVAFESEGRLYFEDNDIISTLYLCDFITLQDGAMVAFESEGRLHFEDNGGTVAVRRAKLADQVIIMI